MKGSATQAPPPTFVADPSTIRARLAELAQERAALRQLLRIVVRHPVLVQSAPHPEGGPHAA